MVRTPPFHGGNMGSNPVGVTKQVKGEPVSFRRRIRLYRILQKALLDEKRRARIIPARRFLFIRRFLMRILSVFMYKRYPFVHQRGYSMFFVFY